MFLMQWIWASSWVSKKQAHGSSLTSSCDGDQGVIKMWCLNDLCWEILLSLFCLFRGQISAGAGDKSFASNPSAGLHARLVQLISTSHFPHLDTWGWNSRKSTPIPILRPTLLVYRAVSTRRSCPHFKNLDWVASAVFPTSPLVSLSTESFQMF